MNNTLQSKKSGIHVIAGLIFLLNAISYGMMLFIPIIEDGIDDFGLTTVISFVTFAGFAIIAVTFLAGVGKGASAFAFGLLAAANIASLVQLFTSSNFKYVKFMYYFPTILLLIAYLFAIAVCQAGSRRIPGKGVLALWCVPALFALASGIIEFINYFDSFKDLCEIVFKHLGELNGAVYALYYVSSFVYFLMYILFPIGLLAGMLWVYKTAGAAPVYSAPHTNPGYVPSQQNPYNFNQPNPGFVPPQQQNYAPPQQQSFTPTPPQQSFTPSQPEPAPAPERKITGYDAMTGQPIYEEAPKKIVGYDAMTGKPIYED